jgi:Tetratricopeptide repeat
VSFEFRNDDRIEQLKMAALRVLCRRLTVVGEIREHARIANLVAHARHLTSVNWTNEEEATLAGWIARHEYERGGYAGARKLQEQVLAAMARLLGQEHHATLRAMKNLAQTLYAQGDLAGARRLGERVLEVRVRLLGNDHPYTRSAMHILAQTLKALRKRRWWQFWLWLKK